MDAKILLPSALFGVLAVMCDAGAFDLAVGSPAVAGALENPQPAAVAGGIGVISGWLCEAERVEFEFVGEQPFSTSRLSGAYGTYRGDTATVCGDTDNGFALLINYNKLGDGEHTLIAYADGVAFARTTFRVTTLGAEFRTGLSGSYVLEGFPVAGSATSIDWQESAQNFAVSGYRAAAAGSLLQPADLTYLGAFRLPGGDERPNTFAYGGNAMTYRPDGDPAGGADGFPGSLLISGHDRMAYGDLPDGGRVAEIGIPAPVIAEQIAGLPTAALLQDFQDVFRGWFTDLEEIPRMAMQYLDHPLTGPKVHGAWGAHLQLGDEPSHVWFEPDLSNPQLQGPWFIDERHPYRVNGYMLEIPAAWADVHVGGMVLGTGRYRDGGWSGQGPNLFAYRPWTAAGDASPARARLPAQALLAYADSTSSDDVTYHTLAGYQHPDEWEGAAWLSTASGRQAVVFAGTKAMGEKFWYGWVNPAGAAYPCPQDGYQGAAACLLADGSACPPAEQRECAGHNDMRGWWASEFSAWLLFYDPADLAAVAAGSLQSWEPQPYAHLDLDARLFLNPAGIETEMLGRGVQRRMRIGDISFDRANGLLYVLELFADGAKPVVHVWRAP